MSASQAAGLVAAAATTASVADPAGDNDPSFDVRGDIRSGERFVYDSSFTVGMTVEEFDDPSSSYNWMAYSLGDPNFLYGTGMIWGLDVNGDQNPDYQAVLVNDGSEVIAGITNGDGTVFRCSGNPSWSASTKSYFMKFACTCIGSPTKVQAQGFMIYETTLDVSSDITSWTHSATKPGTGTSTASPRVGYWMLGADGHVYPFGGAVGFGGLVANATAMAPRRDGKGYWVVDRRGSCIRIRHRAESTAAAPGSAGESSSARSRRRRAAAATGCSRTRAARSRSASERTVT